MMIVLPEDLSQQLEKLARQHNQTPEDLLREWLDTQLTPDPTSKPRTPDLGKGTIWVSDDFDAPLGDSFWLGEE